MDVNLTGIISLLAGLSMASERLVEILRGLFPSLAEVKANAGEEAQRIAKINVLSVLTGLVTAALAKALGVISFDWYQIAALGVLTGAGSSFWNAVLDYILKIRNLAAAKARRVPPPPGSFAASAGK